jgi:DivIVA domain-containing protein
VLIGAIAIVASGRGDSMAEVYDDRPDASLPMGRPLNADDLHSVRLNTGVRGYRMDEVDALLARLEAEMLEREEHADGAEPAEPASREEPAAGDEHTEPASRQEPAEPEYREERASDFPSEPHADHDQYRNP